MYNILQGRLNLWPRWNIFELRKLGNVNHIPLCSLRTSLVTYMLASFIVTSLQSFSSPLTWKLLKTETVTCAWIYLIPLFHGVNVQ